MTAGDLLFVDVLGAIRARRAEGTDVTPDGGLQRRLLALLVLRRGHVVSVDAAIEALWPAGRPRDPVAALHNHLFRLRRGLPDGVIETAGEGYRLEPARIELDADRLAVALSRVADADAMTAVEAALVRWHGPAYPQLDDVDDGRAESVRLAELRIRAREVLAEHRLAVGATGDVVVELAALADDEPLRERPRALLMTALAAAGRTAEALRVYDEFRRLLGAELGIEPSLALAAQHAGLLDGAAETTWTPASRVPTPVTSLVGREQLVDDVMEMVAGHRLVTLIGPGGVGKTRMLVEVGRHVRAGHPDRPVVMCELATAQAESAVDVVAAALAIEGRPGVGLAERVVSALADSTVLLLLDNCEHVLDPIAGFVERLLANCPNVGIVATSRERLRVPGEQLCAVPTLSTSAEDAPAVRLFVERARAVAPAFEPGVDELATVADIVRRLDGLPLAIELAAARLHTLDVAEVAAGLERRFLLLSAGSRASTRHGSLHAAVSWSFALLDEDLQRTFCDLSVFAGSFTASDAAAICGGDETAVTAALGQLVERSLVMRAPGRRYMLLETLRAFGAEQLVADGRAEVAGERHAEHFVAWAQAAEQRMLEGPTAFAEIDDALPELRAALDWLLERRQAGLAGSLVAPLLDYGFLRLRPDVLAWAERVTDLDPDDSSPLAPVMWAMSGYAVWLTGNVSEAYVRGMRSEYASKRTGGDVVAEAHMITGSCALFQGRLDDALKLFGHAYTVAVATGDDAQRLLALSTQPLALAYAGDPAAADSAATLLAAVGEGRSPYAAYAWYCAGEAVLSIDVDEARVRFVRALELADESSASFVAGVAGASKASIDARVGDPRAAADDYRRLITHWRRAGVWATQWTMLRAIAGLLARLDRPRESALLLGAVLATRAGHDIFGADEVTLGELARSLRAELGEDDYQAAIDRGAGLDGDAAIDVALRAL